MRANRALAASLAALAVAAAAFAALACQSPQTGPHDGPESFEADDASAYPYELDASQDLQLPELPTGCEATALSTLLRLNGVDVGKLEVADAMPKSSEDFVHSFLGDPRSENGGCCMAPCSAETARAFLVGSGLEAYETEGGDLDELRTPCVVWVTIGLADPQGPIKTQGAYEMFYPSHCVVFLGIEGDAAMTIDPLEGYAEYPLEDFARVYGELGKQAVYIGEE